MWQQKKINSRRKIIGRRRVLHVCYGPTKRLSRGYSVAASSPEAHPGSNGLPKSTGTIAKLQRVDRRRNSTSPTNEQGSPRPKRIESTFNSKSSGENFYLWTQWSSQRVRRLASFGASCFDSR